MALACKKSIHIDLKFQRLFFTDKIAEIRRCFIKKPDNATAITGHNTFMYTEYADFAAEALVIASITYLSKARSAARGSMLLSTDSSVFANAHPGALFHTSFNDSLNRFNLFFHL